MYQTWFRFEEQSNKYLPKFAILKKTQILMDLDDLHVVVNTYHFTVGC